MADVGHKFNFATNKEQMAVLRTKLGIGPDVNSGHIDQADISFDWALTEGAQVTMTITAVHSTRAKAAPNFMVGHEIGNMLKQV